MGRKKQSKDSFKSKPVAKKEEEETSDRPYASSETAIRRLSTQGKCDLIAELSESVLENPDAAFRSTSQDGESRKGLSLMRQLLAFASDVDHPHVAQLACMSVLAIFKDIIPTYRIRLPTQQEMAVKVSKDTKRMWDYERGLLHHYQVFLQLLDKTGSAVKEGHITPLSTTAVISLCELLRSAFHFNFRNNILTFVCRNMNHQHFVISEACCKAIVYVFENDVQGEVSLEAVRQVAKLIKDRNFKVQPCVLATFSALPLRVHADEAEAAKLASKVNKKKRKRDRETATIEAELRESEATVDKLLLARCQSDMLQAVMLTYFRILKAEDLRASHIEGLLPPALDGLAKFAHLINIDTMMDVLKILRELLVKVDSLPLDAALNCVLTVFKTLQGPGQEMKIDLKEYIVPIYTQLPRLTTNEQCTEILVECLTAAFIKRREYSNTRIAAFVKQILTVAMHVQPSAATPLLAFCRQLFQRYSSVQQLLENEEDVVTSGAYTADVEDPEHANPFATSGWELANLRFHMNPSVAHQANAMATGKLLQLPAETPERLRAECLEDRNEIYVPLKRMSKKHPLEPKKTPDASERKRPRFVTPREARLTVLKVEE